ncbi:MAG: hypothetical protein FD189_2434 [Elusimicrobia bacterium]|nr:MAG: hypothetical protein FD154_2395 [Elusimicrobiota bacterium]KAF0152906.1 MAG: hypothetical protein FD189_2434 [Elusimicrobiota bacterium]
MGISRDLMAGASYYEAVIALEPLLLGKEMSDAQMEAYYLADRISNKLIGEFLLITEFEKLPSTTTYREYMKWEKIVRLNRLGAGITYDHMCGCYDYHHAFLRTYLEKYPAGNYAPAAEFYTIRPGRNELSEVERELKELYAYVKKYPEGRESDKARLKIARINDNLWDLLYHGGWPPFSSGDKARDGARAEECRRTSLSLYKRLLKSRHLSPEELKEAKDRYDGLVSLKHSSVYYITYD